MADNVAITAGSGTNIATDDVAGVHYQRVKLVDGTLDGTGAIGGDATNGLDVDVTRVQGSVTVAQGTAASLNCTEASAGTIATNTGNAATALQIMDDWDNTASDGASVSGDVAHDGTDAGEPVKIGARAIAHGANPTAVAAADRTNLYANRAGVLFVIGGHPNSLTLRATSTGAQTDVALITVSAGTKIVVTSIQVTLSVATTATPSVIIGFGTANTPTTTGVVIAHPGLPGGGGVSRGDGTGIIGVGADDQDLRITNTVPTGGTLDVVVTYFTIES